MADASVIDALVVTLGLDARDFNKKLKDAREARKKFSDNEEDDTKAEERRAKKRQRAIAQVTREVIGLGLALTGVRSLGSFVSDIVAGDAATGRLARNLGVATDRVSAWQYALKTVNGSAADANNSLSRMFSIIEEHKFQGVSSADPILTRLGLGQNDLASPDSMLLALSENRTHDTRQERASLLGQLGLDENTVNVLLQGRRAVEGLLKEGQRLGATTDADAKAAERLQKRWAEFTTALSGQARPYIEATVDQLLDLTKNTDAAAVAMPALIGVVGAVGIAAAIANAPLVALATVIGGVALAVERLSTAEGRSRILRNLTEDANFVKALYGALHDPSGDPRKILGNLGQVFSDGWNGKFRPRGDDAASSSARASSSFKNGVGGLRGFLMARGLTENQARGVEAGILAESKGDPNAYNKKYGAFGIGQWLGSRKATLFAKYGPNPTAQQQLEFLVWELNGGDRGGAAVRAAGSAEEAGQAYITEFMRPKAGAETAGDLMRMRGYLGGARLAVSGGSTNTRSSTSTTETHIGAITVNTRATDARGIAAELPDAIRRRSLTAQANGGLTG